MSNYVLSLFVLGCLVACGSEDDSVGDQAEADTVHEPTSTEAGPQRVAELDDDEDIDVETPRTSRDDEAQIGDGALVADELPDAGAAIAPPSDAGDPGTSSDASVALEPAVGVVGDAGVIRDVEAGDPVRPRMDAAVVDAGPEPQPQFELDPLETCEGPDSDEPVDRCAQLEALGIADARVEPDEGGWQPGESALITVTMSAPEDGESIDTPGLALLVDVGSQGFANA